MQLQLEANLKCNHVSARSLSSLKTINPPVNHNFPTIIILWPTWTFITSYCNKFKLRTFWEVTALKLSRREPNVMLKKVIRHLKLTSWLSSFIIRTTVLLMLLPKINKGIVMRRHIKTIIFAFIPINNSVPHPGTNKKCPKLKPSRIFKNYK